jgi:hypothetical protein
MIELKFSTADGDMVVQFGTPVSTPAAKFPWAIDVRTNGRSQILAGNDPVEALALAAHFASSYLSGRDGLDPPINDLPLARAPDLLAQGFQEGILAVLDVRGMVCTDEARVRVATCTDDAALQRYLRRAKVAATLAEVFAEESPDPPRVGSKF